MSHQGALKLLASIDLDRAIRLHPTHQLARLSEGRPTVDRPQGCRLVTLKVHTSCGTPSKHRNVTSIPSSQADCRS
jgi:hypothetical protein